MEVVEVGETLENVRTYSIVLVEFSIPVLTIKDMIRSISVWIKLLCEPSMSRERIYVHVHYVNEA